MIIFYKDNKLTNWSEGVDLSYLIAAPDELLDLQLRQTMHSY